MKYAIFEYTSPGLKGLRICLSESEAKYGNDKIRFSEYVDIDFPPRTAEEVVPEQIAAIDAQLAEVTDKFGKALAELKARKAELLAIAAPEMVE